MGLMQQLDDDLKAAMKAGDAVRRDTVRLLRGALKNAAIENLGPLDADGEARVVAREAKQRRESIEEYRKGGREDLAEREQAELAVLADYLPEQLTNEGIRDLAVTSIERLGAKRMSDMGAVMKDLMPAIRGRADGGAVNAIVRELLTGASG